MNPYLPIRKVPLDYNGISSSAFAVQMQHPGNTDKMPEWKEAGVEVITICYYLMKK